MPHPAPVPRLLAFGLLVSASALGPGARPAAAQGPGGMLFSYRPHPGERAGFDEGYRAHLAWHRDRSDSLAWYGWDVIAGPRSGDFVDGTFGISFAALDRRVDPAGDAAHAAASFAGHATATGRWAVRHRPELGTATPLEDGRRPPPLAEVVAYDVPHPGRAAFEAAVAAVRRSAAAGRLLPWTVYETAFGGPETRLTLFVWRGDLASFDDPDTDPAAAIARALGDDAGEGVRSTSELWRLRSDLTLLPGDGGGAPEASAAPRDASGSPDPGDAARRDGEGWVAVAPGGATGCGLGDPFEFWVREGPSDELLVFLQGGGACWSHATCAPGPEIRFDPRVTPADRSERRTGVFDAGRPENPFRRATAVFVPYCTGDFHLGDRAVVYEAPPGAASGPVTVRHLGSRNVDAVLDHLAARAHAPSRITVVGASAGAVASPVVAARLARRFPGAAVRQLGDGAAGLRFGAARDLLRLWGADASLAADGFSVPGSGDGLAALYRAAARRAPAVRFSQVATDDDATVAAGLRLVGEEPRVAARIAETYEELSAAGICFTGWVLPGTGHTVVSRPAFFSARVDGVALAERLRRDLLERPCPPPAG